MIATVTKSSAAASAHSFTNLGVALASPRANHNAMGDSIDDFDYITEDFPRHKAQGLISFA